jgi:hypothetical protein
VQDPRSPLRDDLARTPDRVADREPERGALLCRTLLDGRIVIDVTPMRFASVSDGVATVGAGARLGDVYDSLDDQIRRGCSTG